MKEAINYEAGIALAEKNFAEITAKGKKFIERNTPKFMRDELWVPFYITKEKGIEYLHIIHFPAPKRYEKIFFKKFLIEQRE